MFAGEAMWEWDQRRDRLDRAMEWFLIAGLAFMPFAFGAVEAWSEEIVVVWTAALFLCLCTKMVVTRGVSLSWTWAHVCVFAFVALALVQLIPLPTALVRLISPHTVAQKMRVFADLGASLPATMEISFYPYATKHDLRLVLAAAAVFVVVGEVFCRPHQIMRLLLAIAVIGAGVALLALAQDVAGNNKIYWFVSSPHGTAFSGPFVNHSHYAQFMSLSIGAALALICTEAHQALGGHRLSPAAVAEYLGSPDARLLWGLSAMIVVAVATVFTSLSRGGVIGMMIAGAFFTLLTSWRRSLRGSGWVMVLLALVAFVCVLYIGFDAVYERLGTLRALHDVEGGRWQIVRDIAVAWTRFPLLGTGLGTHEVVYPMFDRSTIATLASHAENEYAQAAEETGIIGFLILVAFGVLVWSSYARTIRTTHLPIHSAAYGLGFGLLAIMVQSLSDFGQHVPANASLSAIFCVLLLRLPRIGIHEIDKAVPVEARPRWHGVAVLVALCVLWGGVLLGADRARAGEAHWRKALAAERDLMERQWQGSDEEYTYLLGHAQKAAAYQPDNVMYQHWLNVYRWRAISRATDPNTGGVILPAQALEFTERIAEELNRTRALCPTFGATWCVLGQLERGVLGREEQGARHIREGLALAPCDPTAHLVVGILEAEEGRTDVAIDHLARSVRLDTGLFREVAERLVDEFDRPDVALEVVGEDIRRLNMLADILQASSQNTTALDEVRKKMVLLLEERCKKPDAPAWAFAWLAGISKKEGRVAEAIAYYRQALGADYSKVDWHYDLARLLAEVGSVHEAIQEAKVCLRLRPEHAGARLLIDKLSGSFRVAEQRGR